MWHLVAYPKRGASFRVAIFDNYSDAMDVMQHISRQRWVCDSLSTEVKRLNSEPLKAVLYPLSEIAYLAVIERPDG